MFEEISNWVQIVFSLENFMVLLFTVDAFAVVGIFINAFTGRTTPPKQRVKKRKPRMIDRAKLYYNLEEPPIKIDGEDGVANIEKVVGDKLKPNGTSTGFPTPLEGPPDMFKLLVENSKNKTETKTTPKPQDEKTTTPPQEEEPPLARESKEVHTLQESERNV